MRGDWIDKMTGISNEHIVVNIYAYPDLRIKKAVEDSFLGEKVKDSATFYA